MAKVINLPVPTPITDVDEHARAETERRQRLFEWALAVLKRLRLDQAIVAARSVEELRSITLDANCAEVILAIRDALHPASGRRQEWFRGLNAQSLKHILRNRLTALKKDREEALRRRGGRRRPGQDWSDQLILDEQGEIVPNLTNAILILRENPEWKGVLGYDEFSARVVIRKRPPWGEHVSEDTPWTDHHESLTRVWFENKKINLTLGIIGRAVQATARHNHNRFHPVRDYFAGLTWDRTPRLETWLQEYFGVEDSAYARAIGPRWLISAAARVYRPGCQADHMLVFEGPQGRRKSTALQTLAIRDDWFTDKLSHVSGKDACMEMAGVWIIEVAEMDALTKASASAQKAFLSRRRDRFRPPYGKHTISLLRQCVFAGTINPTIGGYLKDATGARRFWPVACRGMIDCSGLEKMRDQLWAEAVHRFTAGEAWWLETPELEALATAEQAARFLIDAWEGPVAEWLADRTETSIEEVLGGALGLPQEDWSQSAQNRVVKILTRLGFAKYRPRTPDGREYRYRRDSRPKS